MSRNLKLLKWAAILSFIVAMVILLAGGSRMKKELPPYPGKVLDSNGNVLFQKSDIFAGQDVYQRYGLMDHGAVWGHGSQRGPEFSASSLHIIAEAVRDFLAKKEYGRSYGQLDDLKKEFIDVRTKREIKPNRYDAARDTLTLTAAQVEGLERVRQHWDKTFKEGDPRYGFLPNTIRPEKERLQISRFFFWTAWVASTLRPGKDYTYTNNWPPDRSVGNIATTATYFWNFPGAGVFGFLINLPIVNYYEHGTYLTMNHAHAALFGTYGMLSIALLLFSWRGLVDKAHWKDGTLKLSFFGLNIGLFLMTLGTLFPIGAMQVWTSFKEGLWVARDASFFERGAVVLLGNLRVIPDVIIIVLGVLPLAYFLITTYPRLKAVEIKEDESVWERLGIEL